MHNKAKRLLRSIQAVEFTLLELNLYLDTHPHDKKALADFNTMCRQLHALKREYEKCYGLLTPCISNIYYQHSWSWIKEPWPWQICG